MLKNRRDILRQSADAHRDNIRKSLEHRLEVARAQGDQNLVELLEAESRQLS